MLKKTITYATYSGEEVTEDFFFNLTKAELVELEMSHEGGLGESLKKIIASEDGGQIIKEFKNILLKSYGQKSEDGRRFVKNDQMRQEFESTEAYSVIFMELVTDADAAAKFVNSVMPQDLRDEAQLAIVPQPETPKGDTETPLVTSAPSDFAISHPPEHPWGQKPRKLSQVEITEMDADELKSGLTSGRYVL